MVSQTTCLLLLIAALSTSPLLTIAGTTPANCIPAPIWTRFNKTGVFGGNPQTNASTIEACQAGCIASSNCIAIDFDSIARCFFIPTTNANDKVTRDGVTHFDLTRQTCSSTVIPGLVIASGFYSIWYLKTGGVLSIDPNTQLLNVVEDINRAAWLTASPCLASSNANFRGGANCISLSSTRATGSYMRFLSNGSLIFDTSTNQLYPQRFNEDTSFNTYTNVLFSSGGFISVQPAVNPYNSYLTGTVNSSVTLPVIPAIPTLAYNNSASFYPVSAVLPTAVITGRCPNIWTRTSGARWPLDKLLSIGLTSSQGLCRQRCLVYPNCIGISYGFTNGACLLELSGAQNGTALVPDPSYNHYDLTPSFPATCTRGCAYTWTSTTANLDPSTYSRNNSSVNFLNCRITCVSNVNCVGVIWSSSSSSTTCSLIISNTGNVIGGNTTVSYYALMRSFVSCGPCSLTVHITTNAIDSNGVLTLNTVTRAPCRTACVNNPLCTGYDIVDGTCRLSFTNSPLLTSSSTGGYHSDIIRSPCGNGCIDVWEFDTATTGIDTYAYPAATTESTCRQECQISPTCVACDWNIALQLCRFSDVPSTYDLVGTSPGWNHYSWINVTFCDDDLP